MSWQGYIDNIKGQCKGAALQAVGIFGHNGSQWAAENCSLTVEEAANIARHINEGDESICGAGFTVGGQKFAATKLDGEDKTLIGRGKGTDKGCSYDKVAIVVLGTAQALIVAIGAEGAQGGTIVNGCSKVQDYLAQSGY